MRINSKEILLGYPVLKVREVIRLAMKEQLSGTTKETIIDIVAQTINASNAEGRKLFNNLLKEGYLTVENKKFRNKNYWVVTETEKGRHLGVTRANPPIARAKADSLLQELLQRVKEVNKNKDYLYKVSTVKVFGSYLGDKQLLGDLDVAIKLDRKAQGDAYMAWGQERIALAFENGRRFSNYVQELDWPRREVLMHLATRKKGLSMHIEGDDEVLKRVELKTVYELK